MLKAVYLDDKEHKYLIDFILSYKDKNDKNNISSAIRFLMIKGYQSLYSNNENIEKTVQEKINKNNNVIEESLNNAIEQLYNRINTDINNKFNMQLLENNSQLMSALINIANKPAAPQIITQPYMMPASNIITTPINTMSSTPAQLPTIPPEHKISEQAKTQDNNSNNDNNKTDDNNKISNDNIINISQKQKTKKTSSNSLLSNLLSNANR